MSQLLLLVSVAEITAENPTCLPTERSVPVVTISPATPKAIISLTDDCVKIFLKFLILKNEGSFIIIRTNIINNTRIKVHFELKVFL